jgi:hypothetical protein
MHRPILLVLCAAVGLVAQPNTLTSKEAADGWVLLFDGATLFGWTVSGGGGWRVSDGALIADSGEPGWLRHNTRFADYLLHCEFRTAADGNSGVFLRSAIDGAPHQTGYELQIFDNQPAGFHTGSLVGHAKMQKQVRIKPGQWMSFDVEVRGNHFVVKLDGAQVLDARDSKSAAGHLGLQYNKDKKVEFRNIKLKPLGLQPVFNGKDLKGWQIVESPRPRETPIWAVKDGAIHVEKGPGQLETEGAWKDFVLQLDIRTNPQDANHHPNSGVFFRGDVKGYWSGYESQIRNEYKDGDPTQPVDWGTGAIYNRQATRRVVAKDGEYFTKTLVADGRHFSVWINGYPVTDWQDDRPEGSNARQQARLTGGTLSLQAHDPTTNLDFRNLRIASLP